MDPTPTSYTYRGNDAEMLFDELLKELHEMSRTGIIDVHWSYEPVVEGSTNVHSIPYRQETD